MSKRLRVEEERLQKLKEAVEEEEQEDVLKVQLRRIFAPLVWMRTAAGIRIQDMKENYFKDAIDIFTQYYMPNDVLCKNLELAEDEISLSSYTARLMYHLKDQSSLIAIDESTEEQVIAGVLITKVMNKMDFGRVFSRIQLVEGDAMKKYIGLTSHINRKVDVFAKFECDSYLRYYHLCILPEYRGKGLGYAMLRCGMQLARSVDVPVVMGLFPNCALQKLAKRLGMEIIFEVNYMSWLDEEGELIFDDPGAGNYSCALMAGRVLPPPPPPPPPPSKEPEEVDKAAKSTRAEKKAEANKKK